MRPFCSVDRVSTPDANAIRSDDTLPRWDLSSEVPFAACVWPFCDTFLFPLCVVLPPPALHIPEDCLVHGGTSIDSGRFWAAFRAAFCPFQLGTVLHTVEKMAQKAVRKVQIVKLIHVSFVALHTMSAGG